jgi:hypothetical protein
MRGRRRAHQDITSYRRSEGRSVKSSKWIEAAVGGWIGSRMVSSSLFRKYRKGRARRRSCRLLWIPVNTASHEAASGKHRQFGPSDVSRWENARFRSHEGIGCCRSLYEGVRLTDVLIERRTSKTVAIKLRRLPAVRWGPFESPKDPRTHVRRLGFRFTLYRTGWPRASVTLIPWSAPNPH